MLSWTVAAILLAPQGAPVVMMGFYRPSDETTMSRHTYKQIGVLGERKMALPVPKTNITRIANAVPFTLCSRVAMNVEIVVLICQKCNQCLKGHKSLGWLLKGVL